MGPEDRGTSSSSLLERISGSGNLQSPTTAGNNLPATSTVSNNVSSVSQTQQAIKKIEPVASSISKLREPLDDTNWTVWRDRITRVFTYCGVDGYINGTIKRPDPTSIDPNAATIWDTNNVYAQILITNNISKGQMVHVSRMATSHEIWNSLRSIHETKDYRIAIHIQRSLFRQMIVDGGNVIEHLAQLKLQWERLNVLDDRDFHIPDKQFKTIIASSLPESWDVFTEPYVGGRIGTAENDPKKLMSSQEFIGTIKEEYLRRQTRDGNNAMTNYVNNTHQKKNARPFANCIQNAPSTLRCNNCQQTTHDTDSCRWLGQPRCTKCTWFGHIASECRRGPKRKREDDKRQLKRNKTNHTYVATKKRWQRRRNH